MRQNAPAVPYCACTGTGKTAIMRDKLRSLDNEAYMSYTINLNSRHDGPALQPVLEAPLEKKAGVLQPLFVLRRCCSSHPALPAAQWAVSTSPSCGVPNVPCVHHLCRHAVWPSWCQEADLLC